MIETEVPIFRLLGKRLTPAESSFYWSIVSEGHRLNVRDDGVVTFVTSDNALIEVHPDGHVERHDKWCEIRTAKSV